MKTINLIKYKEDNKYKLNRVINQVHKNNNLVQILHKNN
jgi:hypothetical protein